MPEPFDGLARLTPAFPAACRGRVHSVFSRVVNVQMRCGETERLLALVSPDLPAVPDSVCLPPPLLAAFMADETVILEDRRLSWRGHAVRLRADSRYTGRLDALEGRPCAQTLESCTANLRCGLDLLPGALRLRAVQALREGRWQAYLGLGSGLTPSFDDACVGMAAVYTAMGLPLPPLADLSVTTDVSARYLRLAQEGYFGEPLLMLIHALWENAGAVREAARALLTVGASSGSDMLVGVRLGLEKALFGEETVGEG